MKLITALMLLFALPLHAQTVDKKFIAMNGGELGAAVLDMELTQSCIRARTCKEGNPLAPSTMAGQTAMMLGTSASSVGFSYYLKKHHSRLWWMMPAIGLAFHVYGSYTGARYFNRRSILP